MLFAFLLDIVYTFELKYFCIRDTIVRWAFNTKFQVSISNGFDFLFACSHDNGVSPLKLTPWFLSLDNQTKTGELEAEIHENDSEMLRESPQTELILVELGRLIHPEVALKQLNNINHWKVCVLWINDYETLLQLLWTTFNEDSK